MVLNLGSTSQLQGFDGNRFCAIKVKNKKIHDTNFIFRTTNDSMNACMEFVGFSTSNKVKNHCSRITYLKEVFPAAEEPSPILTQFQ